MGSWPALPGGHSAAGEPAGRSPGCGCWDQLLCSAAAAGSPPGGGYSEDRLPCVKLCGHEPVAKREKAAWVTQFTVRCAYSMYLYIHINTCIFKIQFWVSCQCGTHFQVDKVFDVGQGNPQQIAHQINVPLLHSQVQHSLVTFDFLELKNWKWWERKKEKKNTRQNHKSDWEERVGGEWLRTMTSSLLDKNPGTSPSPRICL